MAAGRDDTYQWFVSSFFSDRKIRACTDAEVCYFMALSTSRHQTPAGIMFGVTPDVIAADARGRWTPKEALGLQRALQEPPKNLIVYDEHTEELWVTGYFRHKPANEKVYRGARHVLQRVQSRLIYDGWWQKYGTMEHVRAWVGATIFTGPDPAAAPRLLDLRPEDPPPPTINPAPETVWGYYCDVMKRRGMLTRKRREKVLLRLRDNLIDHETGEARKVTVEDLCRAIDACAASDFHMGRLAKTNGKTYNELEEHIIRDFEQLERWLHPGSRPPDAPPTAPAAPRGPAYPRPPGGGDRIQIDRPATLDLPGDDEVELAPPPPREDPGDEDEGVRRVQWRR